jgi:hypothetical protein
MPDPRSAIRRAAGVAAACLAVACSTPADRPSADSASTATPAPAAPSPAATDSGGGAVHIARERRIDLTGDGAPEHLTLVAHGPRYDSLDVRLEIRGSDDAVLYAADWGSEMYFKYEPAAGQADSTIRRKVTALLDRVLSDTAFVRPRGGRGNGPVVADTSTIRYDVAEQTWRTSHGVAPFAPLPTSAYGAIDSVRVDMARVQRIAGEVAAAPTFTYFSGGELTRTLAWSPSERRFVRIFECC